MWFVFACVMPSDSAGGQDSFPAGGGGGADAPAYCAPVSSTPVATDTVADGMTFSVDDALAIEAGAFAGTLTPYTGDTSPLGLTLSLDEGGAVEAETWELVDPSAGDTGYATGAAEPSGCPPTYRYTLIGELSSADGQYAGAFTSEVHVADPSVDGLTGRIALESFDGTARPGFDVGAWDRVELAVDGTPAWTGSLTWFGLNESARTSAGSDTGTVAVSGVTEGIGAFDLTRE